MRRVYRSLALVAALLFVGVGWVYIDLRRAPVEHLPYGVIAAWADGPNLEILTAASGSPRRFAPSVAETTAFGFCPRGVVIFDRSNNTLTVLGSSKPLNHCPSEWKNAYGWPYFFSSGGRPFARVPFQKAGKTLFHWYGLPSDRSDWVRYSDAGAALVDAGVRLPRRVIDRIAQGALFAISADSRLVATRQEQGITIYGQDHVIRLTPLLESRLGMSHISAMCFGPRSSDLYLGTSAITGLASSIVRVVISEDRPIIIWRQTFPVNGPFVVADEKSHLGKLLFTGYRNAR